MHRLWFYATTALIGILAFLHFNYAESMATLAAFVLFFILPFNGKNVALRLLIFVVAWWFLVMDYALTTESRHANETMYGFSLGWLSLLLLIERYKTYMPLRQERV